MPVSTIEAYKKLSFPAAIEDLIYHVEQWMLPRRDLPKELRELGIPGFFRQGVFSLLAHSGGRCAPRFAELLVPRLQRAGFRDEATKLLAWLGYVNNEQVAKADSLWDSELAASIAVAKVPKRIIRKCVAIQRYRVSDSTLREQLRAGKLTDWRSPGQVEYMIDEAELDQFYTRKTHLT